MGEGWGEGEKTQFLPPPVNSCPDTGACLVPRYGSESLLRRRPGMIDNPSLVPSPTIKRPFSLNKYMELTGCRKPAIIGHTNKIQYQ